MHETLLLLFQSNVGVAEYPCGCCVVYPGSGLSYVQDLGMGETYNVLDKPSVEPHNMIRVASEPDMHILKSIGREGVS